MMCFTTWVKSLSAFLSVLENFFRVSFLFERASKTRIESTLLFAIFLNLDVK